MDVTLSGLGGNLKQSARQNRALCPARSGRPRKAAISGHAGDRRDAQSRARAAGVNHYFVKPVSPAKLAQVLGKARSTERYAFVTPLDSLNDPHDVGHDAIQFEILRRVNRRNAGLFQPGCVLRRDDAADDHRHV